MLTASAQVVWPLLELEVDEVTAGKEENVHGRKPVGGLQRQGRQVPSPKRPGAW